MYAYRPLSLWALQKLLEREMLGQEARYERFMAQMVYILAAGRKIDMERTESFGAQVDQAFKNPFSAKREKEMPRTAAEIKQYVLKLLEE